MSGLVDDVRAAVRVTLTPPAGPQTAAVGKQEALVATAALLLSLWAGKHLAALTGAGSVIFTLIAAFQLYAPLHLIQRAGEAPESHGIHVHGVLLGPVAAVRGLVVRGLRRRRRRRPRWAAPLTRLLAHYGRGASLRGAAFLEDVGRAVVVALVTFAPFALGHHLWQTAVLHHHFGAFQAPDDLHITLLKQVFLIALPEELFYRGFLETRLERVWPNRRTVVGLPLGRAVVVTSALFALGHFVGEYNPARLGPFVPAFIFSMLVRRSRSITGAILYHGLANSFSYFLAYCYH